MVLTLPLGYKLCKHIAQALSHHCAAIHSAIECYNALAPLQRPPHPLLMYSDVVKYCNFSEFEILKHSDHNLLSKDWATLANQQAAKMYFKIECAKEEIPCCNIEVARLQAWVNVEDDNMCRAVATHESGNPAFSDHLKVVQMQHCHVNEHICMWLHQIYSLPGYCGPLLPTATCMLPMQSPVGWWIVVLLTTLPPADLTSRTTPSSKALYALEISPQSTKLVLVPSSLKALKATRSPWAMCSMYLLLKRASCQLTHLHRRVPR